MLRYQRPRTGDVITVPDALTARYDEHPDWTRYDSEPDSQETAKPKPAPQRARTRSRKGN